MFFQGKVCGDSMVPARTTSTWKTHSNPDPLTPPQTSIAMIRKTLSHVKEPQVRLYTDKTAWNYISSLKCCRKRYHTKKKRITPNMNTKEILFHIGQSQNIPITLNIDKPMRKDSVP